MGTDFVGDGPPDLSDLTPPGADPLTVNLNHPTDVQEFPNGDLLVMCWHNHKLRVIDKADGRVRVLLGAAAGLRRRRRRRADKTRWSTSRRTACSIRNGNLFFIDQRNQRIRVHLQLRQPIARTRSSIRVVGTGTRRASTATASALQTQVNFPAGGNPEPAGGIARRRRRHAVLLRHQQQPHPQSRVQRSRHVQERRGHDHRRHRRQPASAATAVRRPRRSINYPEDIEIGPDGNLYFADTDNNRVRMIDLDHRHHHDRRRHRREAATAATAGRRIAAKLNRPFGVAFDPDGDLYISDTFNSRIRKVKLTGPGHESTASAETRRCAAPPHVRVR